MLVSQNTIRSSRFSVRTLAGFIAVALFAFAQAESVRAQGHIFTDENGIAIKGYDVVNYFTANEAARGTAKHTTTYKGATFYFTSEEHRKMFVASPETYLPRYGGYCAYAVAALDKKVPVDPETFKIYNGELYLFFNDYIDGAPVNTSIPWNQDEKQMKKNADSNWKHLSGN